tara:strand:+ start:279 stop:671 length:393 start_codon:yes stop_codon:yes gene_type:complete
MPEPIAPRNLDTAWSVIYFGMYNCQLWLDEQRIRFLAREYKLPEGETLCDVLFGYRLINTLEREFVYYFLKNDWFQAYLNADKLNKNAFAQYVQFRDQVILGAYEACEDEVSDFLNDPEAYWIIRGKGNA